MTRGRGEARVQGLGGGQSKQVRGPRLSAGSRAAHHHRRSASLHSPHPAPVPVCYVSSAGADSARGRHTRPVYPGSVPPAAR
jgi:hypothetical protein